MKQQIAETIACHECDLLVKINPLNCGQKALCPRCGYMLTRVFDNAQNRILALSITSLIFLFFSIPFAFLSFTVQGKERMITLFETIESLAALDFSSIAFLMLISILIIPCCFLLGLIYIITSVKSQKNFPYIKPILKWVFTLLNWNMGEIFLLGILVSYIKITSLGPVTIGLSFWSYILFIASLAAALSYLDKMQVWRWVKNNE